MNLYEIISAYVPRCVQEENDKAQMLQFMQRNSDYLLRENLAAHFTASAWTVNRERTKTLMVHHNLYNTWSWTGGHADGMEDLCAVALKELAEETGLTRAQLVSPEVFSLETLPVNGHMRRSVWVPGHIHFNLTWLAQADESDPLTVLESENSGVRWIAFEDVPTASAEPWMVETVYKKLIGRCR